MLLVDTSVWIHHLRHNEPRLQDLLHQGFVLMHPFVIGELACGNLNGRARFFSYLGMMPSPILATNAEVMKLVDGRRLWGRGLGWIDVHLLASAMLSHCGLWSLDRRLSQAANHLGLPAAR